MLDSITFALFGKPFRKINIPQLVNSLNEKECLVEVEFSAGEDSYLIRRGLKPKVFEVFKNNDLVDIAGKSKDYQRMLEEQVLRMNYKSFTQVVILGSSSFVPFMQLSAADRRTVIEDILDIQVFSNMNSVLRDKTAMVKNEITDINKALQINKERATGVVTLIESLKKKNNQQIETLEDESTSTKPSNSSMMMNLMCWTNRFKPIWKASQMKEMWNQESKSMTRQEERWKER